MSRGSLGKSLYEIKKSQRYRDSRDRCDEPAFSSRRRFILGLGAATAFAGTTGLGSLVGARAASAEQNWSSEQNSGDARRSRSYDLRVDAAAAESQVPIPSHPDNGDENRYFNRMGNFSKGLPHDDELGLVANRRLEEWKEADRLSIRQAQPTPALSC
jgi:hypothetical protein